jgi:hypothetical protein
MHWFFVFIIFLTLLMSSCASVKPWDREGLADPIMIIDENPIDTGIKEHFLDYREGSEGATGAQSGGCGCD